MDIDSRCIVRVGRVVGQSIVTGLSYDDPATVVAGCVTRQGVVVAIVLSNSIKTVQADRVVSHSIAVTGIMDKDPVEIV